MSHTDDRRVRYRRHITGVAVLWHPCEACGYIEASWGYEVGFKDQPHKGLGRWFCYSCRPETDRDGLVLTPRMGELF